MKIKNLTINNKKYIFLIIIIILLIILIIIIIIKITYKKNIESFIGQSNNYQLGVVSNDNAGFVKFNKAFENPPIVFTQVIGNGKIDNSYSIQIFNVSEIGFQYIKNVFINEKADKFTILKMSLSNENGFNWIAYNNINGDNKDKLLQESLQES
jgi:hypothetical protein